MDLRAMRQMLLGLFEGDAGDSKPNRPPARTDQAPAATETIVFEPPIALSDALAPAQFAHPQANRAIVLGQARVAYLLRRGQRRTIGFSVGADGLTVSARRWTTLGGSDAVNT